MIEYAAAIFLVIAFIWILKISRIVENSARVVSITRNSIADLRNPALDDDAKEAAMQTHAKHLFGLFFLITIAGASAVLAPLGVIWVLDRFDLLSLDGVVGVTLSWQFLLASTLVISLLLFAARRSRQD